MKNRKSFPIVLVLTLFVLSLTAEFTKVDLDFKNAISFTDSTDVVEGLVIKVTENEPYDEKQFYRYVPEGKMYFSFSTEKIMIKFSHGLGYEVKQAILSREPAIEILKPGKMLPAPEVTIVNIKELSPKAIFELLYRLELEPNIEYASPFLLSDEGILHSYQNRILLKVKHGDDISNYYNLFKELKIEVLEQNEFDKLMYVLQTTKNSTGNTLELANKLHETGMFKWVEPDFLMLLESLSTNDTYLDYQWALNNTGSSIQFNGTSCSDMNVFNAWTITTGDSNIKIAILDDGVDLTHPDLQDNLLPGYDATGLESDGGQSNNDAHGTACAGLVGAVGNNELGIAGVAYTSKIIPVRFAYKDSLGQNVTTNLGVADAINWAWQTGKADILSISWQLGSSSARNDAIEGALTYGRDSLGSLVLASAGNGNSSTIVWPARHPEVIAVGAMSMCYERKSSTSCDGQTWWGSSYGNELNVMAPGTKIYSIDVVGSAGYTSGDYIPEFGGTSAACPNAAGVMALILSANSTLTRKQAQFALESTCRKVGDYSYGSDTLDKPNGAWNIEMGYGLVDAYSALLYVSDMKEYDAGILFVNDVRGMNCDMNITSINPKISLANFGTATLDSVDIKYQINNGAVQTYKWYGELTSTSTALIQLPELNAGGGKHVLKVFTENPNGETDMNLANDTVFTTFTLQANNLELEIKFDGWPQQTRWDLRDASNNVLFSGGPYPSSWSGTTFTSDMCVDYACYSFTIYDSNGDGICCKGKDKGSYKLVNLNTNETLASGGSFGSSEKTTFCLEPAIVECVYPVGIAASNINDTEATLSWTAASEALSYSVRIREQNGNWSYSTTSNSSINYTNLSACTDYDFEIKSLCDNDSSDFSASYVFKTTGCPDPCDYPVGISATNINNSEATVSWTAASGSLSYSVRIREQNGNWSTSTSTNTSVSFTNLSTCTDYDVEVKTYCDNDSSDYSGTVNFKTTGCSTSTCNAPTGLYVSHINKKRARLNWGSVSGASSYTVQYWVQGSSSVTTSTTTGTNMMLNGLNEQTTYEWHVRTNCSSSSSDYSTVHSFVAGDPNSGTAMQNFDFTSTEQLETVEPLFKLFPNPNTGLFTVFYEDGQERNFNVSVMDLTGRVVYDKEHSGTELNIEIDLSGYAKGTYLLLLSDNNQVLKSSRIVLMD